MTATELFPAAARNEPDGNDGHGNHDGHNQEGHGGHTPGAAFLLALPLLVVFAVAPPSLGAFSAQRASGSVLPDERKGFAPLEPGPDGVADLKMGEVVRRALYDEAATLQGAPVRLTGFVVPGQDGRVLLTRFLIRCCAADGTPAQVSLALPPGIAAPPVDSWVEVVAVLDGQSAATGPPPFTASSLTPVAEPRDPYET